MTDGIEKSGVMAGAANVGLFPFPAHLFQGELDRLEIPRNALDILALKLGTVDDGAMRFSRGAPAPDAEQPLAAAAAELPRVRLRGLMCVPPLQTNAVAARAVFARLRTLFDELNASGHKLDTLSMGMSGDFESAIAEGATLVRIGTALFGSR